MKYCTSRGGKRSSSTPGVFSRRFTAASWSCESRIWNACGSPASRWCARSIRLHRPWKVPIHMPRVFTGSIALTRVSISRAALLVKVTARMPPGVTRPLFTSQAVRVVRTRVLPLPAPARISACSSASVTAASCSGLRCSRCSDKALQLYRAAPASRAVEPHAQPAGGEYGLRPRRSAERAHHRAHVLLHRVLRDVQLAGDRLVLHALEQQRQHFAQGHAEQGDRKSTRLNSSHVRISYAVFCLKKKKNISISTEVISCDNI